MGYFDTAEEGGVKYYVQLAMVLAIYASGVGSYVWIAKDISLSDSVSKGIHVMDPIPTHGWICFILFWALVFIYYHVEMIESSKSFGSALHWAFVERFHVDSKWETVFNTPNYNGQPIERADERLKTKVDLLKGVNTSSMPVESEEDLAPDMDLATAKYQVELEVAPVGDSQDAHAE